MSHFETFVFRFDIVFQHSLSEISHHRHGVLENLVSEITGTTIQSGHFGEKFCRLKTFFCGHSHGSSGRGDQDNVRANLINSVDTLFEACFALGRGSVIFTNVKVNNSCACVYSGFCFSHDLFYCIRNGRVLFFGNFCPANGCCDN